MRRTLLLSGLTAFMLVVGLVTVNGVVLALALPLILALSIGIVYGAEELDLSAERWLSTERLVEGSTLRVTVTVTNNGSTLAEAHISDVLSSRLTVTDGDTTLITSLAKGESATLEYELSGPRGAYSFPSLRIAATDYLGLFWRRDDLFVAGKTESLIVPKVESVSHISIRPRQTRAFAGYIPARIAGTGLDFFSVREYRQGDSLRHVNWRASARHDGAIFTNEFEQERVADVGIILDARQRAITRRGSTKLLEYEIAAATTFSDAFLSAGNRVSLLIYGNFLNWTLPGYGKIQKQKILQSLSGVTLGTSQVFDKLEYLPTRLFPAKSQIVVFSTVMDDDIDSLRRMRARGYQVLVVSPDPVTFEYSLMPESAEAKLAARIARIERELTLRELRQAGIQVVNWNVRQPISELVKAKLQKPWRTQGGPA